MRPIAIAYYVQSTLIAAWCELREDYRHFRADRVMTATVLDEHFDARDGELTSAWLALKAADAAGAPERF